MRNKTLFLALTIVVACGAGPVRDASSAANQIAGLRPTVGQRQATVAQVAFKGSEGMTIQWDVAQIGDFASVPVVCRDSKAASKTSRQLWTQNCQEPRRPVLYPTLTIMRYRTASGSQRDPGEVHRERF